MTATFRTPARVLVLALLACLVSCGGTQTTPPPPTRTPLELQLRTSTGSSIDLADHRGSLVLLAMLGTYDTTSQAALESLSRFERHHEDVVVVGILVQQGADLLVDAYASAAGVSFPIAYSVDESLLAGTSALGRVDAVPMFIALDAEGVPAARHEGFATERTLEMLVETARAAAPVPDRTNLPLLGTPR